MGREPGGEWQPRGWHGRWIKIGDRVRLVGFGRTGTVRGANRRRGVTVQWDDGGTTTVPPHRLKVVEPTGFTPPRRIPEPDPSARPDGAAAYFSRPGHPGDAWVRYDENGDLDGWVRYNRDDPSTISRYREVFNDPAWRQTVEAMGLREAPPPAARRESAQPHTEEDRWRPPLGELIPESQDDIDERADEMEEGFRAELESRRYAGYGLVIDTIDLEYSDYYGGTATLDASIVTEDGHHAGMTTRIFHRDPDGTLWVSHDYLLLYENHQGKGFASAWNRHMEQWYRESGLERIELTASLTAGGYAWARDGYVWRDQHQPGTFGERSDNKVIPRLEAEILRLELLLRANRDGSIPQEFRMIDERLAQEQRELEEARAILERFQLPFDHENYPLPRDVAMIGWRQGRSPKDDPWLGLRVMAGSTWKGVKWLT